MAMHPANLALVGIDVFNLTAEQSAEAQHNLDNDQRILASIDEEIALAQAQLEKLKSQRSETQKAIMMASIPSESQASIILEGIEEQGALLEQLEKDICEALEAREEMERLVAEANDGLASTATFEDLCAERERHEIHLTHLKLERDQAQVHIEALQSMLSPIRRIPVEILSEIFVRCLSKEGFTRPSSGEAPLVLMMICRRWRDVAVSTSSSISTLIERCHWHLSP